MFNIIAIINSCSRQKEDLTYIRRECFVQAAFTVSFFEYVRMLDARSNFSHNDWFMNGDVDT